MDWDSIDWSALERLRSIFLGQAPAAGPYWTSARELEAYDFTLGRRIAWKWAAVLEPLVAQGWRPPARHLVDWGCGTGIAARSMLAYLPADSFAEVSLWDHAPAATQFAAAALRTRYPHVSIRVEDPAETARTGAFVLVVSHVLNELGEPARAALLALARRASAVIWVEPGTAADSRALIAMREQLRGEFHCWAPCPHDLRCGMLALENERHWCHHFARPPTEAFTDRGWAQFAQRLGVDLRSLPYSHLVLDRRPPARPLDLARVIGTPRTSARVMKVLRCREGGVAGLELQKRDAPALWRTLTKAHSPGLLAWSEGDGRIHAPAPIPAGESVIPRETDQVSP